MHTQKQIAKDEEEEKKAEKRNSKAHEMQRQRKKMIFVRLLCVAFFSRCTFLVLLSSCRLMSFYFAFNTLFFFLHCAHCVLHYVPHFSIIVAVLFSPLLLSVDENRFFLFCVCAAAAATVVLVLYDYCY